MQLDADTIQLFKDIKSVLPEDVLSGNRSLLQYDNYLNGVGYNGLKMFLHRAVHLSQPSAYCRREVEAMLSDRVLAQGFDALFGDLDLDLEVSSAAIGCVRSVKAGALQHAIGFLIERNDFDISGITATIISRVSIRIHKIYSSSDSPVRDLLLYLSTASIENGLDHIQCDRIGDFYVGLFYCDKLPLVGRIIGDCCSTLEVAKESVASRVLLKLDQIQCFSKKERLRTEDSVPVVLPSASVNQSRPKVRLLMLLQRHGLKESLGEVVATLSDATAPSPCFYSEFYYPASLINKPGLINVGTIRGASCSSKKAAEDSVCQLAIDSIIR